MSQLESMIKQIVLEMNNGSSPSYTPGATGSYSYADYPLGEKRQDKLQTPTGKNISQVTLDAVLSGQIDAGDMRITPETLEMQAQIAESRGRGVFASNLRRAAELIAIPDERILQMYNSLRPYQSTKQELMDMANELRTKYNAKTTAAFVEEAAQVYESRGRLKK